MVIEVEHSLGPGESETKLTARWVASTDTRDVNADPSKRKQIGSNVNGTPKCATVTGN